MSSTTKSSQSFGVVALALALGVGGVLLIVSRVNAGHPLALTRPGSTAPPPSSSKCLSEETRVTQLQDTLRNVEAQEQAASVPLQRQGLAQEVASISAELKTAQTTLNTCRGGSSASTTTGGGNPVAPVAGTTPTVKDDPTTPKQATTPQDSCRSQQAKVQELQMTWNENDRILKSATTTAAQRQKAGAERGYIGAQLNDAATQLAACRSHGR